MQVTVSQKLTEEVYHSYPQSVYAKHLKTLADVDTANLGWKSIMAPYLQHGTVVDLEPGQLLVVAAKYATLTTYALYTTDGDTLVRIPDEEIKQAAVNHPVLGEKAKRAHWLTRTALYADSYLIEPTLPKDFVLLDWIAELSKLAEFDQDHRATARAYWRMQRDVRDDR